MTTRVVHKTCNLCEAMCGLELEVDTVAGRVEKIRADANDPLSAGAICPKAIGLREIHEDPDRLKTPVRRVAPGVYQPISWDEALDWTAARIVEIQRRHGDDAVGSYLGNPGAHNLGTILTISLLASALGSRNRYAASSLDQNPKHASSILLYGNFLAIPVPDVDRTDFLLVLGANPLVSNGSLMSAPGFRRRLRALRARGGRLVVVDPRRSETAEQADLHLALEPGRDALLLAALVHTVLDEKLGRRGRLDDLADGLPALTGALVPFAPESVAGDLGLTAHEIRALARAFAGARTAACYARIGTCVSSFGTLASWLVDVLNLLTGNLDREGGVLLPTPAADLAALAERRGEPGRLASTVTRVRGAPEFNGERPTACLAEEILTPGRGQLRALVTVAGNPCLSVPGGRELARAFASLELCVAVDFYVNETTRHAHVILPPTASLEHDNYEILFHAFAVRNTAKYSPVVLPPSPEQRDEWWIVSQLALRIREQRATNPLSRAALRLARRLVPTPRRALDWLLRMGPYGDGFRPWRKGLRLRDLERAPSGVDLGPLRPRIREWLLEHGRRLDLAPAPIVTELERLARQRGGVARAEGELLLIGRREMRSNNSWFHNLPHAMSGPDRCRLWMHPDDAALRGLADGARVQVESAAGRIEVPLEHHDAMRRGVVSLPHGYGHGVPGTQLRVAREHAGASLNELTDPAVLEPITGNAVLNGVPVRVTAA